MAEHVTDGWRTASGLPLAPWYDASDVPDDWWAAVGAPPGRAPFLRGPYEGMYRTQPWRIFQLSGYGNPEDEGRRLRFLLEQGETGFIMEHDRNTADHLYDVDNPEVVARREDVGRVGAVIMSVRDYETVLEGIPLESVYAHPGGGVVQHAPFTLAAYWTVARRRGIALDRLYGTGQSDFFLTYVGCPPKQQIPPAAGLRLNADIIEFCEQHLPHWVPVSIAGYNGADSGLNGVQELGAVMAAAVAHLDEIARRGHADLSALARGVGGINLRASMDLFEDVAKFRAARKMWHDLLATRYGITNPRSSQLRIHALTAGSAMTYQQPLNNLVRGTIMGLAGVLGGAQSLGVSGYDEAISIPSDHAHQMSIRTQQILQHETPLMAVADPFAGSYFIESLTADVLEAAWAVFEQIEARGGFIACLDDGWLHDLARDNEAELNRRRREGNAHTIGVTTARSDVSPFTVQGFEGTTDAWERGMERLAALRRERDGAATTAALRELGRACATGANTMPAVLEAVAADATIGEIGDVFRAEFGDWDSPIRW
ncbi:methylmalonyl-CoA mutase family protein [Euzebya sp.]|uniref:methylmalonyl-CoA mutase family protein n=1 Tax=Euzebya sp. TaxID=1971409 RepID=UPI003511A816